MMISVYVKTERKSMIFFRLVVVIKYVKARAKTVDFVLVFMRSPLGDFGGKRCFLTRKAILY